MRFTTKTGLKLDKSELKLLVKASNLLADIERHTHSEECRIHAQESSKSLTHVMESLGDTVKHPEIAPA